MKKIILILSLIGIIIFGAINYLTTKNYDPTNLDKLKEKYPKEYSTSTDHSRFEVLKKKFNSPQEITEACISCHNGRDEDLMK